MKNNRNPLYSAVHYALAAGVVSTLGASNVVLAQDEDVTELERVEVTGSRIRRTDIVGPNPIQVIQREELLDTGLVTIGDILQNLPIAGSALNRNVNNGGNGAVFLDLRNLGAQRLLVLVNGRRWIAAGPFGQVDFTTIPTAIVERVEILKDGASAIYGSDAISGVVNIITRKDFTGAQANAYYGEYDEGDGAYTQADFSLGTAGEDTSVYFNVSYAEGEPVFAGDRDISKEPTFGTGNARGSLGTPEGVVIAPVGAFDREFGYEGYAYLTLDEGAVFPGGAPASAYRPFVPADRYNFAPDNYLLTPFQRTSLFMQGRHELTDNIAFFAQASYTKRESSQLLAANPLFLGGLVVNPLCIPADQQFNPFDITFGTQCGGVPFAVTRRFLEAGNRIFRQNVYTYLFTGGFQGNFELAGRYWNWETYYTYAKNETWDDNTGEQNVARLALALGPECETTPGCVPFNIFGGAGGNTAEEVAQTGGSITQEMVDFVNARTRGFTLAERTGYAANITGSLFDLPAGPVGIAVGYEYRRQKGANIPDYLRITGQLAGNAVTATQGSFDVNSAYVEFAIPILADLPLAETLEASVAARYSDYSNFGNTTNLKFGLRWQPFSDLLLRGTVGEAFRAPSVGELFRGQADSFLTITDPCSDFLALPPDEGTGSRDTPQPQNVIDNCIAQGVPADGSYSQFNEQIRVTLGGNPDLGPETADTVTFGLVYSPSWLDGFDLTLDYFDYEIEEAIGNLGAESILEGCVIGGNQTLCALADRNAQGIVTDLRATLLNLSSLETSGADLILNYAFPQTPVGFFELTSSSTYVDEYIIGTPNVTTGGTDFNEFTNTAGDVTIPHWKSNLYLDWSFADWSANLTFRYIGDLVEPCIFGTGSTFASLCSDPGLDVDGDGFGINELDATIYTDLQVSYHFSPWDTRLSVGGRNILDEDPPVCFNCFANGYAPSTYDVPGRFWYARVTTNF